MKRHIIPLIACATFLVRGGGVNRERLLRKRGLLLRLKRGDGEPHAPCVEGQRERMGSQREDGPARKVERELRRTDAIHPMRPRCTPRRRVVRLVAQFARRQHDGLVWRLIVCL